MRELNLKKTANLGVSGAINRGRTMFNLFYSIPRDVVKLCAL